MCVWGGGGHWAICASDSRTQHHRGRGVARRATILTFNTDGVPLPSALQPAPPFVTHELASKFDTKSTIFSLFISVFMLLYVHRSHTRLIMDGNRTNGALSNKILDVNCLFDSQVFSVDKTGFEKASPQRTPGDAHRARRQSRELARAK